MSEGPRGERTVCAEPPRPEVPVEQAERPSWVDVLVKHDGVVGTWHRWIVATAALVTFLGYSLLGLAYTVRVALLGLESVSSLQPKFLLVFVPLGILIGDMGYQRDFEINRDGPPEPDAPSAKPPVHP